jgi:7,8-dihydropterin-6-yl-methyl-4-(beta-D-ribofuranosyl)aminobenzene 5'-phosphate synthase
MLTLTGTMDNAQAQSTFCRITVVFNNIPHMAGLQTAWGFSCVVEGFEQTLLFDTGSNGEILLDNMRHLGIDPLSIDAVVLSHYHGDHTGGLSAFLAVNPEVVLYVPRSFPPAFHKKMKHIAIDFIPIDTPEQLFDHVYSTGQMGDGIREQALILDTPQGLVIITGCAHPGIVRITEQAGDFLGKKIYLVMGGFHMIGLSPSRVKGKLQQLKTMGVHKVAPSHCTGERAIEAFHEQWGDDFITGGCGAVIELKP